MAKKQMTLGQLIETLERKDPSEDVRFDFAHFRPNGIHSYRGDYQFLALGYGHEDVTVGKLLEILKDANCKEFTGYKGGEYVMHSGTPVYVAQYNESGGTGVVDVIDAGWRGIVLETALVD